jgi:hypothetical protein
MAGAKCLNWPGKFWCTKRMFMVLRLYGNHRMYPEKTDFNASVFLIEIFWNRLDYSTVNPSRDFFEYFYLMKYQIYFT